MIFVQFSHGLLCGQKILRQSKAKGKKRDQREEEKEREKQKNEEWMTQRNKKEKGEKKDMDKSVWTCWHCDGQTNGQDYCLCSTTCPSIAWHSRLCCSALAWALCQGAKPFKMVSGVKPYLERSGEEQRPASISQSVPLNPNHRHIVLIMLWKRLLTGHSDESPTPVFQRRK